VASEREGKKTKATSGNGRLDARSRMSTAKSKPNANGKCKLELKLLPNNSKFNPK
jgi:hypothetical protein